MVESRKCCKLEHRVLCIFTCARANVCALALNQEGTQKLLWMGRWNSSTRVENLPNRCNSERSYSIGMMQKADVTGKHQRFELDKDVAQQHLSIEDLVCSLDTCKKRKDGAYALRLHAYMRENGLDTHRLLGNYLISTLAEVGNMHAAHQLFNKLEVRDEWSFNALISGYIKFGKPQNAFALYEEVRDDESGCINAHSFIALLKACAKKKDLETGMNLHASVASKGLLKSDPFVGNTLVDMYSKCGALCRAQGVFEDLQIRDVVSWTALIGGYTEQGLGKEALKYYELMQCQGVVPNAVTLVCSLKACCNLKAIYKGQEIHAEAERRGFVEHDLAVGNTIVDMYAKSGALDKARQVFDKLVTRDVISWTALIVGYTEHDDGEEALRCFDQMRLESTCPNAVTYASSLKACGVVGAIKKGKEVHARIENMGILDRDLVVDNALVDMYAKCGLMSIAQDVFTDLRFQNVVAWTALISGYADYGHDEEALKCLNCMQAEGISLDSVSLVCSLKACGNMRAALKGLEIHAEIERLGAVLKDPFIGSTLVNMYAKCGSLRKAQEVFVKLPVQDLNTWTALIAAFIDHGHCNEALDWFEKMRVNSVVPNAATLMHCVKACGSLIIAHEGRRFHAEIEKMGLLEGNLAVGNALIDMYTKVSLLNEAIEVFDKLPVRNIVSWNALIAGYVDHDLGNEADNFVKQMQFEGVSPDPFTYVCKLKACDDIDEVKRIHSEVEKKGFFDSKLELSNTMVDVYAKYGLLITAKEIFERLPDRDVVSWNVLLTGYLEHECGEEVLRIIEEMHLANVSPDSVTFVCGVRACGQVGAREKGQELHAEIERQGLLDIDIGVGNSLVDMYGKWGLLARAHEVFYKLPEKDTISWTVLIAGYAEHDHGEEALACFERMGLEGVSPNEATFACILKACIKVGATDKAQEIHCEIERQGILGKDLVVGNTLIDFYAKSGMFGKAQEVLDRIPSRDACSWTALITGYAEDGYGVEAVKLYKDMQSEGLSPDAHTFACSLKACGIIGATELGQQIHTDLERKGLWEADIITSNTLVDMYAKSGSLLVAEQLLRKLTIRDIVAWNALILGCVDQGYGEKALKYLDQMLLEGIDPNAITFVGSLKACSTIQATQRGQELHIMLDRRGLLHGDILLSNALLDMYSKLGSLAKAEQLFDKLSVRNVVSWTSLIVGYIEHGQGNKALNYYEQMQHEGVHPNLVTCVCSLKACVTIGAIEKGREIHTAIVRRGFVEGLVIGNTLIHMYAKNGLIEEAQNVFDRHPTENIVSWNVLIAGYSKLGKNTSVFQLFKTMVGKGVKPSMVTFVIILNACSRSCLFDCCLMYFEAMSKDYGVVLSVEHITNIVGLLCRAGQLNNALAVIDKMPVFPNLAVWRNMLNVCKDGGNLNLGHQVFERAMCLEKLDSAACVLMSHIYAGAR